VLVGHMRAHTYMTLLRKKRFKWWFCDFYTQVNSIQTHAEREMKRLSDKWRKKEMKMKKNNEVEKEKVRN
jgi:hypothetical protein